jgi:hypothetical protein
MKKVLFIVTIVVFQTTLLFSQTWVGLTSNDPAPPEITLINSTNQQVSFTVEMSGFYATSTAEKGVNYQRLSIPGGGRTGEIGAPEMPVITQRIAIPKCSAVNYSVQVTASQTLQGYMVYPVPERETDSLGKQSETFYINSAAYQTNAFAPVESYVELETGALRSQHYVELELHPIQFNPVTEELQVITAMEISLTFVNPTTNVNVNVGIFNNVAKSTFLNFEDTGIKASINDKAFEKEGFVQGNVAWVDIFDTAMVKNIVADYLIICAAPFHESKCAEIQRIADYRAWYNGFDVAILNVEHILSDLVGFYYEGTPDPFGTPEAYKKEQRIRTCIRMIYEGQNAQHTHDGHLGYVLLVGDVDAGNTGMPSSGLNTCHDYYFSCVTKGVNNIYDNVGDLFIEKVYINNNNKKKIYQPTNTQIIFKY